VVSDAAASVLLPPLLERMRTEAPGVRLSVSQHSGTGEDLRAALRHHDGVVLPHELAGMTRAVPLFEDRWACVADPQHGPGPGPLTAEEAAAHPWVLVAMAASGQPIGLGQLLSLDIEPRVILVLDHFSGVPSTLWGTPNLAVVPQRLVAAHAAFAGLRSMACPWPTPPFRMAMHWDPALEHDAGHRWFRDLVAEAAATVRGR
jgi:DNA-binding transcriptional LysR family regulator